MHALQYTQLAMQGASGSTAAACMGKLLQHPPSYSLPAAEGDHYAIRGEQLPLLGGAAIAVSPGCEWRWPSTENGREAALEALELA